MSLASSKLASGFIVLLAAGITAFASDFKDVDIPSGTKGFKYEWSNDSYGGKLHIHENSTGTIKVRYALLDCGRITIDANCEVDIEIGDDVEGTIHVGPHSKANIHVLDSVDRGGKVVFDNTATGRVKVDEERFGEIVCNRELVKVEVGRGN